MTYEEETVLGVGQMAAALQRIEQVLTSLAKQQRWTYLPGSESCEAGRPMRIDRATGQVFALEMRRRQEPGPDGLPAGFYCWVRQRMQADVLPEVTGPDGLTRPEALWRGGVDPSKGGEQ